MGVYFVCYRFEVVESFRLWIHSFANGKEWMEFNSNGYYLQVQLAHVAGAHSLYPKWMSRRSSVKCVTRDIGRRPRLERERSD